MVARFFLKLRSSNRQPADQQTAGQQIAGLTAGPAYINYILGKKG
jgi:hypothetical protein